jgi:hypothetical protein
VFVAPPKSSVVVVGVVITRSAPSVSPDADSAIRISASPLKALTMCAKAALLRVFTPVRPEIDVIAV